MSRIRDKCHNLLGRLTTFPFLLLTLLLRDLKFRVKQECYVLMNVIHMKKQVLKEPLVKKQEWLLHSIILYDRWKGYQPWTAYD